MLVSIKDRNKTLADQLPCPIAKNYLLSSNENKIKLKKNDPKMICTFCEYIIAVVPLTEIHNFKI